MLDYSRITFDEIEVEEAPKLYFFSYDISHGELKKLIEQEIGEEDTINGLCLTEYSNIDYKLEVIIDSEEGQYWEEIYSHAPREVVEKLLNKVVV